VWDQPLELEKCLLNFINPRIVGFLFIFYGHPGLDHYFKIALQWLRVPLNFEVVTLKKLFHKQRIALKNDNIQLLYGLEKNPKLKGLVVAN
jgi:hypothetical protein